MKHFTWQCARRATWLCGLWLASWSLPFGAHGAEPLEMHPTIASQLRYVDPRISGGRILVETETPRNVTSSSRSNQRNERLSVSCNGVSVSLHYEINAQAWQLVYDVVNSREVTVRRTPVGGATGSTLEFTQPASGPLVAKIERPDGKYELTGQTLWQLLLSNPKLCEAELIPSLQVIHTQWHLAPTVAALEKSLLRTAPITAGFDLAKTMHWVEQLGADTFRARQEAQRQLVELGPTVVPILRHLNADELDAEQRHRLRQIVRELTSDDHDDSVDHLTSLLAGDAWTWLVLIRRDEEDVRRMAWQRLSRLLPQPLEFDPAGTPEKRAAQAAVIERTIQSAFANHSPVANP